MRKTDPTLPRYGADPVQVPSVTFEAKPLHFNPMANQRSEMNRLETIEETAALIEQEGGRAIAVPVDHLDQAKVKALDRKHRA